MYYYIIYRTIYVANHNLCSSIINYLYQFYGQSWTLYL